MREAISLQRVLAPEAVISGNAGYGFLALASLRGLLSSPNS